MPTDREETLTRAEKLLRQGRLDAAIAEYSLVVSAYPRDWNTSNLLGDLYVRAGQVARACEQYTRVADHLAAEGFSAKAAALYKKVIKFNPSDEPALLRSAELAAAQGLTADVRGYMNAVFQLRLRRGDRTGAIEVARKRVALDPAEVLGHLDAARMLAEAGDVPGAAGELRLAGLSLRELRRLPEALRALREAWRFEPDHPDTRSALFDVFLDQGDPVGAADYAATAAEWRMLAARCRAAGFDDAARNALARLLERDPDDADARAALAKHSLELGDLDGAAKWVTPDAALASPPLAVLLAEVYLRQGRLDEGRVLLAEVLSRDAGLETAVIALSGRLADADVEAATSALLPVVDHLCDCGDFEGAGRRLEVFLRASPGSVPALQRLIEICVDGGFSEQLRDAQARLTDALLARERWHEARSIADDLVAGEPGHAGHLDRLRRALHGLGLDDVLPAGAGLAPEPGDEPAAGHVGLLSDDFSDLVAALSAEASTAPPESRWPVGPARAGAPSAAPPAAAADEPDVALPPSLADEQGRHAERPMLDEEFRRLFEDLDGPKPDAPTDATIEVDLSLALESLLAEEPAATGQERQPDLDGYFQGLRDKANPGGTEEDGERLLREGEASCAAGHADQAAAQLRAAARDPKVRLQASRLLGRMARDRGALDEAIEWFERAAEVPAPELETWQALLYELGDTLDVAGEHARALAVLLELRAATPGYRNVESRVAELSSRQAGPWPTGTRRSA